MRIAYIILAHKLPDQLVRLVHKLNTAATMFFIHVDKKTDADAYRRMTEHLAIHDNVYFLDRHARYYGDYNHVRATLEGIHKILEFGMHYDYVLLLTGQDYPIKSNSQIQKVLQESGQKSFMEYFPLPDARWKGENGGFDRINYWHLHWRGWEFAVLKKNRFLRPFPNKAWFFLAKIFPFRRKLPGNLEWYGGSAYWCFTKECIEYINEFVQPKKEFVKFFEHVKIPEEIFFQTVLLNSPFKSQLVNDNLRYIVWSNSRHPAILGRENFKHFMSTNKLFARKFDITIDEVVLDMIDQATS